MQVWCLLSLVCIAGQQSGVVPPVGVFRDAYGAPKVRGTDWTATWFLAGRAVAEDRLWQMEMSRRIARSRLAEILGKRGLDSDKEIAKTSYTKEELEQMLEALPEKALEAYEWYAKGVNYVMRDLKNKNKLPQGYADLGFEPEPWSTVDSAAIAVRLARQFGSGGGGELRNLAILSYLKTQPCKDKVLDVLNDFAWQNDSEATPTLSGADDPLAKTPPSFPTITQKITESHHATLPNTNLFELFGAIRLAERQVSTRVAMHENVFYKAGSYAILVGPKRSATGRAMLLSAPQMGHRTPSVVHEIVIETRGFAVAGLNVPGVPGVILGHTPRFAWGLTSGVADTDDIFFNPIQEGGYLYEGKTHKLEEIPFEIKVKGAPPETLIQKRTAYGPVILESKVGNVLYSRKSAHWKRELEGFGYIFEMAQSKNPKEFDQVLAKIPMSFNCFYAFDDGQIGYRFCGAIPRRAPNYDPRFPTPGAMAENDWKGMMPAAQMPHAFNPPSGLLANWNNKPAAWWPNFDTPVWGRIFRNKVLLESLPSSRKLGLYDLEKAAWQIARREEATCLEFLPLFRKALSKMRYDWVKQEAIDDLLAFDGWMTAGSVGASLYKECVDALREELFVPSVGNFINPQFLHLAAQPTLMAKALAGKTRYDYLKGRSPHNLAQAAFEKAHAKLTLLHGSSHSMRWGYQPASMRYPGAAQADVPYDNRGTYIQITEMRLNNPYARNVLAPGVAESGTHAFDQISLARSWSFKPMQPFGHEPAKG